MVCTNRTKEFSDLVHEKQSSSQPSRKHQNLRQVQQDRERDEQVQFGKQYVADAYIILNGISKMSRMLGSIRKAYLNVDTRSGPSRLHDQKPLDINDADSWSNIRQLSNEQRDQMDMHARLFLSRCADRVKEMEALEKKRVELLASRANPLARFLPTRLMPDKSSSSADYVSAHHTGITWYLNRRLTEASESQKEMQEERIKRQTERSRTLGSGAALEALRLNPAESLVMGEQSGQVSNNSSSWLNSSTPSNLIAAAIGAPSPNPSHSTFTNTTTMPEPSIPSDDEDDDLELTSSQILQFETENANILRSAQEDLEAIQQAESRLMDISALQMELVSHLTKQTEITDQLYEDAVATTSMVEKGNTQLREARRRSQDSRLFILVFLIGASFSLLFLHYY
ncbi:hypothetical protein K435DRAFT_740922 [Dendrothele bispora CBS 962.96]|uniref:t-SNARE coiled-coil homology domain-containing protein n=1 Tax=Dendrothele bispora (strain CBS 962.96) TaxID=1314807 RepID=A0A4S8MZL7_DENBC|nr:hypothetical protein K435DRAFT_740922 [Dendrothele bispora CBS 962.96]